MGEKLILGCDFDGTFRLSGDIRPEELDAARRFRDAGNLFGIVTGRNVRESLMAVVPMCRGCADFVICSTGGVCILPDGSYLFRHTVDGAVLPEIYNISTALHMTYMIFDVTDCPCDVDPLEDGESMFDGIEGVGRGEIYLSGSSRGIFFRHIIASEHLEKFRAFNQCTVVFADPEYAEQAAAVLDEKLAPLGLVTHNAYTSIDITRKTVNKAAGLLEYAKANGVPAESVIACGDGKNDAEMLEAFRSYAIEGSDPGAVSAAGGRTVPNVAELINKLLIY